MEDISFEVRDQRIKEKFYLDDAYLNGFARICGINATGVYVSLCRHANKLQEAFPSIQLMAEELNISFSSTQRAIRTLASHRIITITREKNSSGQWRRNTYTLLDKKHWSISPQVTQTAGNHRSEKGKTTGHTDQNHRSQGPIKDTHMKDTHIRNRERLEKLRKQLIEKGAIAG